MLQSVIKISMLFLFPLLTFAQNQFPDTLYLLDGRTVPCIITSIDDEHLYLNYGENLNESIILKALQKLTVENFGTVILSGNLYNVDKDKLEEFLEERARKITEQQKINEELARISFQQVEKNENIAPAYKPVLNKSIKNKDFKHWSFGILYVPYYSGNVYNVIRDDFYSTGVVVYASSKSYVNLESQLAYGISKNFKITFDAGYSSTFEDSRYESHQRSNNTEYDNGTIKTTGLKILDFTLGLKYYLNDIITENVTVNVSAGFGKQIAFAQNDYEILFQQPDPNIIRGNNIEEYTEQLNSPWHFNIGFGAEYFFNESLSLTSNIRVLYSTVTGTYNSRTVYEIPDYYTISEEKTFRDFTTKIGVGLNFYF